MNIAVGAVNNTQGTATVYFAYPACTGADPSLACKLPSSYSLGCGNVSNIWAVTANAWWYLSTAQVNAQGQMTFSPPQLIDSDTKWPLCTMADFGKGSAYSTNKARPALTYAWDYFTPANTRIATVLVRSMTKQGDLNPADVGTRAVLYESTSGNQGTWSTETALCGFYGDFSMWMGWPLPPTEPFCMQYGPSMAAFSAYSDSEIAWAWHDTRDNSDGQHAAIYGCTIHPGPVYNGWNVAEISDRSAPGVPWTQGPPGCGGTDTSWGDYEGMTVDPWWSGGKFFAAWGDSRSTVPTGLTQIYSGYFFAP